MGTMLYNGVELPNIDTVWTDKVTYPYAYLYDANGTEIGLFLTTWKYTYKAGYLYTGIGKYRLYKLTDGVWSHAATSNYPGVTQHFDFWLWASYDIIDESGGGVRYAASDPVDPNATTVDTSRRLKSLINGLLCGLVSPGQLKAREATMYSYNGVPLPALPEWDRESYPYAAIIRWGDGRASGAEYGFIAANSPIVIKTFDDGGDAPILDNSSPDGGYANNSKDDAYVFDYLNGEWVDKGEEIFWVGLNYVAPINGLPIWTAHDIYRVTATEPNPPTATYGDLYLAASDPVPVYE